MAQHDSRPPAAWRTVISLSDGFSRRLSPFSLPFSPVYLARFGPKSSTNQSLGSFAASKHRLKAAKTVPASNRASTKVHSALGRLHQLGDGGTDGLGVPIAAEIAGARTALDQGGRDRPLDRFGRLGIAEVAHHHGARPDLADRVGDELARDVRGTALHPLP